MKISRQMEALMRQEGFVPVAKAALAIGVHVTTVYHLMDSGAVRERRAGSFRFVDARGLAAHYGGGVFEERLGLKPAAQAEPKKAH